MAKAELRLTEEQAAENPAGQLVLNGKPDDHATSIVHTSGMQDARALTSEDALSALADTGMDSPQVEREIWEFEDPVTNEIRKVEVWVPNSGDGAE